MGSRKSSPEAYTKYHKDGSLWAKGQTLGGVETGYREWFRKDGTRMRSGTFEDGKQIGEWTTYDREGEVYRVTVMKKREGGAAEDD
jgi:antitoxin component YwqK of YwqJK toxin-antitoxin module